VTLSGSVYKEIALGITPVVILAVGTSVLNRARVTGILKAGQL